MSGRAPPSAEERDRASARRKAGSENARVVKRGAPAAQAKRGGADVSRSARGEVGASPRFERAGALRAHTASPLGSQCLAQPASRTAAPAQPELVCRAPRSPVFVLCPQSRTTATDEASAREIQPTGSFVTTIFHNFGRKLEPLTAIAYIFVGGFPARPSSLTNYRGNRSRRSDAGRE